MVYAYKRNHTAKWQFATVRPMHGAYVELREFADGQKFRLTFKSARGFGTLVTTAAHAVNPNRSQRFFPPAGTDAAMLGWAEPHWYAHEVIRVEVVADTAQNARA